MILSKVDETVSILDTFLSVVFVKHKIKQVQYLPYLDPSL